MAITTTLFPIVDEINLIISSWTRSLGLSSGYLPWTVIAATPVSANLFTKLRVSSAYI